MGAEEKEERIINVWNQKIFSEKLINIWGDDDVERVVESSHCIIS